MQAGDVITEVTNAPWLVLWGIDRPGQVIYPLRGGGFALMTLPDGDED